MTAAQELRTLTNFTDKWKGVSIKQKRKKYTLLVDNRPIRTLEYDLMLKDLINLYIFFEITYI